MGKSKHNQLPKEFRQERSRKQQLLQEQAAVARLNKAGRWYDTVLRSVKGMAFYEDVLSQAIVIDAENVYDLLFNITDEAQRRFHKDVVALPPFPVVFVEFPVTTTERAMGFRVGFSMEWANIEQVERSQYPDLPHDTQWMISAYLYAEILPMPIILLTIPISGDGKFSGVMYSTSPTEDGGEKVIDLAKGWLSVALVAITFMHCKNVQLIDCVPDVVLNQKHERKFGVPMTRYKVLKVTSVRKRESDTDRDETDSATLPKSLHIVRGHFKDYRNGNGRFGRDHGIYWIDAHVRGDEKQGVIIKDYKPIPE